LATQFTKGVIYFLLLFTAAINSHRHTNILLFWLSFANTCLFKLI
jgi:hypothetical protein